MCICVCIFIYTHCILGVYIMCIYIYMCVSYEFMKFIVWFYLFVHRFLYLSLCSCICFSSLCILIDNFNAF